MNFTELVAAAQERARRRSEAAAAGSAAADGLALQRMAELTELLSHQAEAIRALPAVVTMSPTLLRIEVLHEHRTLRLEVFFETEVWKSFFLTWDLITPTRCDDGHRKAFTADEAVLLLAEMIGRHLAGASPVDDAV